MLYIYIYYIHIYIYMDGVNLVPHDCKTAPFSVHWGHGAEKDISLFVCWCIYIYIYLYEYMHAPFVICIHIYIYIYIYTNGANLVPHDRNTAPFSVHWGHEAKKYLSLFVCWSIYICIYACTSCVLFIYYRHIQTIKMM